MATNKTTPNTGDVEAFLNSIDNAKRRVDAFRVLELMKRVTGEQAMMWGGSIVGFGSYHYRYESGREGDFMKTGFSPRKTALTMYIMPGFKSFDGLMGRLGKYKTGKSCLYVKSLEDIDLAVLEQLVRESVACIEKKYPEAS